MTQQTDALGLLLLTGIAALAASVGVALIAFGFFKPWELVVFLFVGLAFLKVGLPGQAQQQGIAKSKWATRADLEAASIDERTPRSMPETEAGKEGIYLGSFVDALGAITLRYKGPKHLLSFGPPGTNKSTGLVVPNIAHLPRSMIVIDPKGQLTAISARKRAAIGNVIVLNPFDIFADEWPHMQSHGWNPLLQLDPQSFDFEGDARCVADALIDKSGGGGNSEFFQNSAENLVAALVMWERFTKGKRASLRNIRAELSSPTFYDKKTKQPINGLLHTLKCMAECDEYAIRNVGARLYARLTDANSQATSAQDVIDTVLSSTRFLDDPRIGCDMAQGGAINFGALHRTITTIYLILPVHELVAQAKWLRMFVNLALRQLYKSPPPRGASLPPVLFMLDEFANLGRLKEIITALGASRDYSIQMWMFLQSLSQLKAHYPKEWPLFFSGAGAVTTFKAGDRETQEELSKLYGNREEYIQTQTRGGVSNTPHAIPLIRSEDIGRLGRGATINLIEPCDMPVLAIAPVYPETPYATGLDPNPYYRG